LRSAIEVLEPASRQLLSTLALLSSAVDYETVAAFDPHLAPKGKLRSLMYCEGSTNLAETIQDLEDRGLLQYDPRTNRYDLHPVVRGLAAGGMKTKDKERYGQRVVDHFSSQPDNPYEQARTMEDVENGLQVVRILLQLGHYQEAADAYRGELANALLFNLKGIVETLSLLSFFFPTGWDQPPKDLSASLVSCLANDAAIALTIYGEGQKALIAYEVSLRLLTETKSWHELRIAITNIAWNLLEQNLVAKALPLHRLAFSFATQAKDDEVLFRSRLFLFEAQSELGQWQDADATWRMLDKMGRNWDRGVYLQGTAEESFARFQFFQGILHEAHLTAVANLAEQSGNRVTLRLVHQLRGLWWLERGEWALAAASFDQAVTMARHRRLLDETSETCLALAKVHLGLFEGDEGNSEAERLARLRRPAHRYLARLCQAIGDLEQAKAHALKAYKWAWADGEPYVHPYELTKTTELLNELGVEIPNLPPYDPTKDEPFPWEADVHAAIEEIRAEKRSGRQF
jgi:tetratricopeptide (TPR) repeat protein